MFNLPVPFLYRTLTGTVPQGLPSKYLSVFITEYEWRVNEVARAVIWNSVRAAPPLSEPARGSTHPPRSLLLVISVQTRQQCKHKHVPGILHFSTKEPPPSFQLGERFNSFPGAENIDLFNPASFLGFENYCVCLPTLTVQDCSLQNQ